MHITHITAYIFLYLVQGRFLTVAGVTIAICAAPFVGILNLVALAVWPDWLVVAICETLRKVAFCDMQMFFNYKNTIINIHLLYSSFGEIHNYDLLFLCYRKAHCDCCCYINLQVVTYVVTRPGRELLFTVISQDEKYKAKVWPSILSLLPFPSLLMMI